MARRLRGVGDSTPAKDDRSKYVIKYVACTREYFPDASGRFTVQPTVRTTVRGSHNRKTTCDAIRQAGGRVVSVRRGWL
jgi:hypothetical protein